jgi:hypothetical protein
LQAATRKSFEAAIRGLAASGLDKGWLGTGAPLSPMLHESTYKQGPYSRKIAEEPIVLRPKDFLQSNGPGPSNSCSESLYISQYLLDEQI